MIEINETNFPDVNFRKYLLSQDYGKDGVLTDESIKEITKIDVSWRDISNLKGIEYFTSLKELYCYENELKDLDVSKNTELICLNCGYNEITTLDISKNIKLQKLECDGNDLVTLDVSNNTELIELSCGGTEITSLDVSNNIKLTKLSCDYSELKIQPQNATMSAKV